MTRDQTLYAGMTDYFQAQVEFGKSRGYIDQPKKSTQMYKEKL